MPKKPKYNEVACPKCKEPIAVDAQICPHCRTEFAPAEVATRVQERNRMVGIGCGLLLLVALVIAMLGSGNETTPAPTPSATSSGEDEAPEPGSAAADVKAATISFYSALFEGMGPCDRAAKHTAQVAAGFETGASSIYDGYSAATSQASACRESWGTLNDLAIPAELKGPAEEAAEKARDACSNAAIAKQMGAETMQEVFDGNMKPSKVEEMRQQAEAAQAGVLACAVSAMGVAMKAGVKIEDLPKFE